jgi:hypothetical protein
VESEINYKLLVMDYLQKTVFSILLFNCFCHETFASQQVSEDLMYNWVLEKIYLTTDRSCYAAGDTVWLNAWVLNSGTLEPTDKSRMLHVELIRPDGSILRHIVLDASQGLAPGQLVLPPGITGDAVFRIRAYTRWSLNFDESYRFEKIIPVVQFKDHVWQGPKISGTKNYEWVRRPNGRWAWRRKTETVPSDGLQVTSSGQVTDTHVTRHLSLIWICNSFPKTVAGWRVFHAAWRSGQLHPTGAG